MVTRSQCGLAWIICRFWDAEKSIDESRQSDVRAAGLLWLTALFRCVGLRLHRRRARAAAASDVARRSPDLHALSFIVYAAGFRRNRKRIKRAVSDVVGLRGRRRNWSNRGTGFTQTSAGVALASSLGPDCCGDCVDCATRARDG